jgi:hypothetical protein
MPQQIVIAETTVSVLGERRMVGHRIGQIKTAEPAICQVKMNLFTEPAFRSNAKAIPHQQHADQEFGINPLSCIFNALPVNGWASGVAVKLREMLVDAGQIHEAINRT